MDGLRLLDGLVQLAHAVGAADDGDGVIDALVAALGSCLGAPHACVFLVEPGRDVLQVVASRGFGTEGVGAEVPFGVGPVGVAARDRRVVRFDSIRNQLRYAAAVAAGGERREIGLPGLPDVDSVLAVPIQSRGRLLGVLLAESAQRGAFGPAYVAAFEVAAAHVGARLDLLVATVPDEDVPALAEAPPRAAPSTGELLQARCYPEDDSVFIGTDYVIKGVAGRILRTMLEANQRTGRTAFSNKELRLEHGERLPWAKDNLESRLILLRRRLDEKRLGVRLLRAGRGRLELVADGPVIVSVEGARG